MSSPSIAIAAGDSLAANPKTKEEKTFITCLIFGRDVSSTSEWSNINPGSIRASAAPLTVSEYLSENSRWTELARACNERNALQSPPLSFCVETPLATENTASDGMILFAHIRLREHLQDHLPSLWARLLRSILFTAHAARSNANDGISCVIKQALQHVDAWSTYLASITKPKPSLIADTSKSLPACAVHACWFDVEKCHATTQRYELNLAYSRAATIAATIGCGPVNIFTDVVLDIDSCDTLIAHATFVKTGGTDAWSVGLLPVAKERDKRHFLSRGSAAIARSHSHSMSGIQRATMPNGSQITTWVNMKKRTWNISAPNEELVTISIPDEEFPLTIAFNGSSGVTITLHADAPLPDELTEEIEELTSAFGPAISEDVRDYRLCVDDISGSHPEVLFELLESGFPDSFITRHSEAIAAALLLVTSEPVKGNTSKDSTTKQSQAAASGGQTLSDTSGEQKHLPSIKSMIETCWTDDSVVLPMHGVFYIGSIRLNCASSNFDLFFPPSIYGNFDGVDVHAVPQHASAVQHASADLIQDCLHNAEVSVIVPLLKALSLKEGRSCCAVAVLHGLEDAAPKADHNTVPLLLHPRAPTPVICSTLAFLTTQLTAYESEDLAASAIFEAAQDPLLKLVQYFCCQKSDVALKPGISVTIYGEEEQFNGAAATVCQCIDGDRYICALWSPPESPRTRQYATVDGRHLQFSSVSHDVWIALLRFVLACSVKKPAFLIGRSSLAEILFSDVNLGTGAVHIETMLAEARRAVGRTCCTLPQQPNEPADIAAGAPNNWPPILDTVVAALCSCGLSTLNGIFVHFLRGYKHFVSTFTETKQNKSGLSRCKCILLFEAMCNHLNKHWDQGMYYEFVSEATSRLFSEPQSDGFSQAWTLFPAAAVAPFIRCLIKLALCGSFPPACIVPSLSFFQNIFNRHDLMYGVFDKDTDAMSEAHIAATYRLFAGFKTLLKITEPHLLSKKPTEQLDGLQYVPVHRDLFRLIECSLGDVAVAHVFHTVPLRASLLLGWCRIELDDHVEVIPILHSVVIASLLRLRVPTSVADVSLHSLLDSRIIEQCLCDLIKSGHVCKSMSEHPLYALTEGAASVFKEPSCSKQQKSAQSSSSSSPAQPKLHGIKQFSSAENSFFDYSVANVSDFVRIIHYIMMVLLGQNTVSAPPQAIELPASVVAEAPRERGAAAGVAQERVPAFESELMLMQQISDSLSVSFRDIRCALSYLEMKNIISSAALSTKRDFVFRSEGPTANAAGGKLLASKTNASSKKRRRKQGWRRRKIESLTLDTLEMLREMLKKSASPLQNAILFTPVDSVAPDLDECTGCVEFPDKFAAQRYFGEIISQLSDTLNVPFFTAAKELTLCHGDVCRVILKSLDVTMYDKVFGAASPASFKSRPPSHASNSTVISVCAVCGDVGDEDISIIRLPCGDCLCEDCFASRFLNEQGALPETETPYPQTGDGTPKSKPDYFTCSVCNQELPSSFWESFPQIFAHAQQSSYCKPQLTLAGVHARIVASVLRKLRCDPAAAVARCPDASPAAGRYAVAFGWNHEVSCFGSKFESIIHARSVTVESGLASYGLSVSESEKWSKIQQELKSFDNKSKKLNQAGKRMVLQGSKYYCGATYTQTPSAVSGEAIHSDAPPRVCSASGGQCSDCLVTAAELAQEIQPVFVQERERGDRAQDIRMCPRCFGGYFINMWCGDLAAHQGQEMEFSVKNVCPDCGFFSKNWADYPKANEALKEQTLRSRIPFLEMLNTFVVQADRALGRTLAAFGDKQPLLAAISDKPVTVFLETAASRTFVRSLMIEARRACIVTAIHSMNPRATINGTSKFARLMLLLLGLSNGYSQQFCPPLELGESYAKNQDAPVISAVLMSFAALQCWTPAALDNILSGDVGESYVARSFVQNLMDEALNHVVDVFPPHLQEGLREKLADKRKEVRKRR